MSEDISGPTTGAGGPKDILGKRVVPAAARRPLLFLNDMRARAFENWAAAGMPQGDGAHFWLEAEQEIRDGR